MAKKENLSLVELLEQALVIDEDKPYEVPINWVWTKLKSITLPMVTTKPDENKKHFRYIDIDAIDNLTQSIREYKTIQTVMAPSRASRGLEEGNTLFSMVRPYLRNIAFVYKEYADCIASTGFFVCRPSYRINPRFLFYVLCSEYVIVGLTSLMRGDNSPSIKGSELQNYPIPFPPLPEQQRIVKLIETLFEKLDRAKELLQNTLDSFEMRKSAILHKAFTGELTVKWREENGISLDSWELRRISEICQVVRGGSPRPAGDIRYYNGDIPFLKVADITRSGKMYINSSEYSIKEAGLNRTRLIDANTLLLTNSGATLGVPAICTIKTTFNDGIAAFLGLDSRSLEFFYYFWTSKTQMLRAINKGAAQPNLNTDIIGNIEVNLPTIDEQVEIAMVLDNLLDKEQRAKELMDLIENIDRMKKSILARAFCGELSTNNPNEESALELLKEVLRERVEG